MPSQYPAPGPCVVLPENTLRCCYYFGITNNGPVRLAGVFPNQRIEPCPPEMAECPSCHESEAAAVKRCADLRKKLGWAKDRVQLLLDLERAEHTLATVQMHRQMFRARMKHAQASPLLDMVRDEASVLQSE